MDFSDRDSTERRRRVSISTLPELTRASTFEIELDIALSKFRFRAKKVWRIFKKAGRVVGKVIWIIILTPWWPLIGFFILADKLNVFMGQKDVNER